MPPKYRAAPGYSLIVLGGVVATFLSSINHPPPVGYRFYPLRFFVQHYVKLLLPKNFFTPCNDLYVAPVNTYSASVFKTPARMKKAFVIGLLFLNLVGYSQKNKLEYGFQGGINLNRAYGDGVTNSLLSSTTGLSVGAHIKWNTSSHFGIRALPSYDQFGWAYRGLMFESGIFTGSKTDVFYKLNYINLPILAEYSVGKRVKWNIDAGIFTGFLLKGKLVMTNSLPLAPGQLAVEKSEIQNVKKLNFGLAIGTGLQVPLTSNIFLNLDVRNSTRLIRTIKQGSGYSSTKTLTYSFLSGLSFQL